MMSKPVRRSWLLTPTHDEEAVANARNSEADVVVLDLMELLPETRKPEARRKARGALCALSEGSAQVFLHADAQLLYADLNAMVWPGLNGVIVGRVETPNTILEADLVLNELEGQRGILPGTVEIIASVETAIGNKAAFAITQVCRRVTGLTLGRADLAMDLRFEPSGEIHMMPYLMQRLITIANAAGVSPLGAWWRYPSRGLSASPEDTYWAALRGRRLGFTGSMCLSPEQTGPLNKGFTPNESEVKEATRLCRAYTEAGNDGQSAKLIDDRIIDAAVASQAHSLLAYSFACS